MGFGLSPGKLGFKLGDVLIGLQSGTTDTPESIASTQNKLHTLGYMWDADSLSYVVPKQGLTDEQLRASAVPVSVANGSDVALGATTDAAVSTDTTGTISGKLRGIVKILANVWNSATSRIKAELPSMTLADFIQALENDTGFQLMDSADRVVSGMKAETTQCV